MSGIGAMRMPVIVLQKTRIPQPGGGGISDYEPYYADKADITDDRSFRTQEDSQNVMSNTLKVRMRVWPSMPIDKSNLIEYGGRRFSITELKIKEERRRYYLLKIEENV